MVTTRLTASDMDAFFRPFTIGFDRVFDNLHTVKDIASNYPPYNIIRKDEDTYSIELACAGFREDEFNIHLVPEGNKLVVQGVRILLMIGTYVSMHDLILFFNYDQQFMLGSESI